jgi:3-O-methylgallate 3,4-dioxygenase
LDTRRTNLYAPPDGKALSYEDLLAQADPAIIKEITPEKMEARAAANQRGIAKVAEAYASAAPDVLLIIGDDQDEVIHHHNMPAMCVYWGDSVATVPRDVAHQPEAAKVAAWAHGDAVKTHPVESGLARHIIESLIDQEFDVAHSQYLREGQGIGHAFSFVYNRIMNGKEVPTIPIMLNTYFPPNQPTPKRCYDLGRALRVAVESWKSPARVGIIASGGLSHFVVDEELDRQVLKALEAHDAQALSSLPRERLNAGTSEIRNWVAVGGAVEDLDMELFDYVPCYRSPAGTGCAMAFARWA